MDSMASRPSMMAFRSFDICRRPYSVLLNPSEGLATTTLYEESFVWLLVLHSVLLQCPHVLLRGSDFIQIQVCTFTISHHFRFYIGALRWTEKTDVRTSNSFFCWIEYSFGMVHVVKKWIISSKFLSMTRTTKGCASGNPSSKLVGSSLVSICDKWSGPVFRRSGFTTTPKSYSWNNKSHLHMCPLAQPYWPSTLAWNGLYTSWNVILENSAGIFGVRTPLPTPHAQLWNSSSQLWTIYDLQKR